MASFGDENLSIVVRLKDEASAALKELESKFSGLSKRIEPAIGASVAFAGAMAAAGTAVGAFGLKAVKSAANMEQTMVAFETMLGSAQKAKDFYADLVKFAASTPFELKGLEQASKQLLAYGFQQQEILPNLRALGDIASGVGMDKLPNLILAFGQVKAATKLTGMELRQFTEAGVPLLDQLSQQMHKPVAAIQEMVSAGQIGFPEVQKALQSLTGEGGRFNDLMTKQSKTLGGMWSNLQDAWEQFLRGEGQHLIDWAKQFVAVLIDIVQNQLPKWIQQIQQVIAWFEKHKTAIYIVAGAITGALVPAVYAAAAAFYALAAPLAPFIIGGAIIGGLVAGIVWVVKHWDMLKDKATEAWEWIKNTITQNIDTILAYIGPAGWFILAIKKIIENWDMLMAKTSEIWGAIVDFIKSSIALVVGIVASFLDWIAPGWDEALLGMWNSWMENWDAFRNKATEVLTAVQDAVGGFFGMIMGAVGTGMDTIKRIWVTVWSGISSFFIGLWEPVRQAVKSVVDFIIEQVQRAIDLYNKLKDLLNKPLQAVGNAVSGAGNAVSNFFNDAMSRGKGILGFEHGGLINAPRGEAVPIVAHGQERIIPAGQDSGGGVGFTVVINNPQFRNEDDEARMKRMLDAYFRPLMTNYKIR